MQVYHLSYPFELPVQGMPDAQVLAIGDFDGTHLGHQEVIRRAIRAGAAMKLPASILTFHPHPREVLGQDKYRQILTPLKDKLERFSELGVENTYVISFDVPFSQISPQQFIESVLVRMGVESVLVGFDFTFGFRGQGTADTLSTLSGGRFSVEVVRPYHLDGEKVSSTLIREHLLSGRLDQANRLLGRPYRIRGTVMHGDARGRTIGFPTANVEPSDRYVIPERGVYAVRFLIGDVWRDGVMNIGVKPTFAGIEEKQTLEVHLFDFDRDIYGEQVTIELIGYLRGERKFNSIGELIAQIASDAEAAQNILFPSR